MTQQLVTLKYAYVCFMVSIMPAVCSIYNTCIITLYLHCMPTGHRTLLKVNSSLTTTTGHWTNYAGQSFQLHTGRNKLFSQDTARYRTIDNIAQYCFFCHVL